MTLSTIDPRPALIVIELQKGFMTRPTAHPVDEIVRRAAQLAGAFRDKGLPVVLVNVTGMAPGRTDADWFEQAEEDEQTLPPDWADLVTELDAHPDDVLITKQRWGAFHDTALHERLQELGVTQIVLAGVRPRRDHHHRRSTRPAREVPLTRRVAALRSSLIGRWRCADAARMLELT